MMDKATGDVTAVIETPKGSANKYDYDPEYAVFRLVRVLPEGMTFPYDFGFVPSTLGEDGDPLDVLVFLDVPAIVGCVMTIRLIGVIEARQRNKGEDWFRNDRFLAVATQDRRYNHVQALDDLRPNLVDEIEAFFFYYNEMNGKEFERINRGDARTARKLIDEGEAAFRAKQGIGKRQAT